LSAGEELRRAARTTSLAAALFCLQAAPARAEISTAPCQIKAADVPAGAVIGDILIDNQNIFDLSDPAENNRVYRFANRMHVRTQPRVIRGQLLFAPGDAYVPRLFEESERILRSRGYIYDSRICPIRIHDGTVDVRVTTRDVWTLKPDIGFTREGGENEFGVRLEEANLLGTGMSIGWARDLDVDRSTTAFFFSDQHLGDSWVALSATVADSSDGDAFGLDVRRPFFSLDTRRAGGATFIDDERIDTLYDRGDEVEEFRHLERVLRGFFGRSTGLVAGWARRWTVGVAFEEDRFAFEPGPFETMVLPEDRRFFYPFVGVEIIQDKFEEATNLDQIGRTEDFFLGTAFSAELGFASDALGSDRNALLFNTAVNYGLEPATGRLWLFSGGLTGRWEGGSVANAVLSGSARHFRRNSDRSVTFLSLHADWAEDLDRDNQLLLGGDNGLRGYPLRYQSGDQRVIATIEQRYFTDYYPLRLFRLGFAAFFDVGRTWGDNVAGAENLGLLRDFGVGMRLGSTRAGGGNVIHIDLAFPVDGEDDISALQVLFQTKASF
jgi:hypothetical protein